MIVQLIEVLIGLALVYLIFSTIASALVEAVEMALQKRGKFLEAGIKEILAAVAQKVDAADVRRFYESPFISSLFRDSYQPGGSKLPSYISAERFTEAVLQLARSNETTFVAFVAQMTAMASSDAPDPETIKKLCVRYFDESMERVSGWYQRYARRWLLVIGFCIATFCNVDTLQIMHVLSQDDTLREQIVEEATRQTDHRAAPGTTASFEDVTARVNEQMQLVESLGLPIGWTKPELCRVTGWACPESRDDGTSALEVASTQRAMPLLSKLFGLVLTAFALTFGAPFWFDLLNQLTNLRTSLKPKTTEAKEAAAKAAATPAQQPQPEEK